MAMLLLMSLLSACLLVLDDRLQHAVHPTNLATLRPDWFAMVLLLSACLWLGGSRWAVNLVLAMFAAMQLFQLCHIAAIGRPLTPLDVAMIPRELGDILAAARAEAGAHWTTLLAGGVPYLLVFVLFNFALPRVPLPRTRWALAAAALLLAAIPHSASRHGMVRFMPSPERASLHNSLLAFSYYAVNLAGQPVRRNDAPYRPYRITRDAAGGPPRASSIWLVIFDSTRTDHWGLAGYARDTTPTMSRWVARGEARWHRGIAGAAATRASLTLLLNGVREPGNLAQLRSHQSNLFRLGKQAGYRTYWLSTQYGGKLLEDLDTASIDVVRTRDDDLARVDALGDDAIFDMLAPLRPDEPRLVVLLLRTAHIPYKDAYRRSGKPPRWAGGASLSPGKRKNDAYDSAIAYEDELVARLYRRFEQLDEQGLFVVTSDHGQMLGEDGVWGHNVLTPQIAQVPILVRSRGPAQPPLGDNGEWIAHHELARTLAARMGYRIDNPNARPGWYYLQGSDLFGDNLYREARVINGRLHLGELTGLGHAHR